MNFVRTDRGIIWTTENTSRLISMYKTYPCVFDTSSIGYKDKISRQEVWLHIASQLGTTKDEVVKKIRGLRTQYAREKARLAARTSEGLPITNTWTHYESMTFLDEFVTARSNRNIDWNQDFNQELMCTVEDDGSNERASLVYEVREQIKNELDENEDCVMVTPTNPSPSQSSVTPPLQFSSHPIINRGLKRKKPSPSSKAQTPLVSYPSQLTPKEVQPTIASRSLAIQMPSYTTSKDAQPSVSSTNETQEETRPNSGEDDEIFARYITSELRQITDPHLKRVVKHKIQNLIFDAHCALQQK